MDAHRRQRLTAVLEAEGLDALVATTTENVYYVSGLRSISHALFRGLELYAVFTRRGTALVVPFIDTTGVAADRIEVDHVACYGKFFFEYADDPGEIGRKVREWTRAPAPSPADALAGVLGELGVLGRRVGLDEGNLFAPTWTRVEERLAGTALVPAYQMFRQARMVKGPDEVAALERAALVAEDGIAAVLGMLKPGVTERDAACVRAGGAAPRRPAVLHRGDHRRARGPSRRVPLGSGAPSGRSRALRSRMPLGPLSLGHLTHGRAGRAQRQAGALLRGDPRRRARRDRRHEARRAREPTLRPRRPRHPRARPAPLSATPCRPRDRARALRSADDQRDDEHRARCRHGVLRRDAVLRARLGRCAGRGRRGGDADRRADADPVKPGPRRHRIRRPSCDSYWRSSPCCSRPGPPGKRPRPSASASPPR